MKDAADIAPRTANAGKFSDPDVTAKGEPRAHVALTRAETLWFNTGTLCNIECENCYILSSPTNDALVYITEAEVTEYLDQIEARKWPVREIAFTGGEPFMNPQMIGMARAALARGYDVLILTNAMRPMMRKSMRAGIIELNDAYPGKMTFRISVDHWSEDLHDKERGKGALARTLEGMDWLRDTGVPMAVAGRTVWGESEAEGRAGYARLYAERGYAIDAADPGATVLFPEMDEEAEVPEITTGCWDILGTSPDAVMCASSRMVVKRKGAARPAVLACTLLPYAPEFELGETLAEAERQVSLNHPHCAKFCVLGGASCSA
ncbi:4Fe-4S single cluster domain-containing protein [Roseovarius nanhaiticus]|uniref:4Fe-4S single cluster domain-containing protein n=1 Tax=Roseovarius nanhaiticus TaxID=573024 RepID=A0A1N7GCT3_9RHOB|nr:radical SAM protein [Roseovarius nanhaiticus]SEK30570.1 4Fe-4S single cluster domain-containing protein [Roseovarius nanhaiticus]SIS10358.1 4Fe-4S single cluster domain-containing protein [Roseovarius nanhaiticus]